MLNAFRHLGETEKRKSTARSASSSMQGSNLVRTSLGGSKPKANPTTIDQVSVQMSSVMDRARGSVGQSAQAARTSVTEATGPPPLASESCCPNLTFEERLYGCGGCFLIGIVIGLASWLMWNFNKYGEFAIMYTIGNVVSLSSTFFLMGPKRQCRRMKSAKRQWATAIYLVSMVVTVVVALTCHGSAGCSILILACVLVQWCALIWYLASYVPYGQKMIKGTFKTITNF